MELCEKDTIMILVFTTWIAAQIAAFYRQHGDVKPVNSIDDEGAKVLATALASGSCPKGLVRDLATKTIGDQGAKALGTALASGNCPQGLVLNLCRNYKYLGDDGATALAGALQSGKCPERLVLNLEWNTIGNEGAEALARALESGKCPEGFELKLLGSNIGDEGVKALAAALESGKCPEGLVLNLGWSNGNLGDDGAIALAGALQSGKCPERLVLNLEWSSIGNEGKAALETALKSGKVPFGTEIVGLGLEQLCRVNDTKTALLALLSTKKSHLPIPDVLVHTAASYLTGCVSERKIKSLIKSVTDIQSISDHEIQPPTDIIYAGVKYNLGISKLLTKPHNLVRESTTLSSTLSAPINFFKTNAPSSLYGDYTQDSDVSTLPKTNSQTNMQPLPHQDSKNESGAIEIKSEHIPPSPPVSA